MRCPVQTSLINKAKALYAVPFKHLQQWSNEAAEINAEVWLKPLNTLRTEMPTAFHGNTAVATLPRLWVLSEIHNWEGGGPGLYRCLDDWDWLHCHGDATDEEREMMRQMLEDWHRDFNHFCQDWLEYQDSVCEEDWAKTWYLEDFAEDYDEIVA